MHSGLLLLMLLLQQHQLQLDAARASAQLLAHADVGAPAKDSECPRACAIWSDGCNEYRCEAGRLTQLLTHRSCKVGALSAMERCMQQHTPPTRAPADRCAPGSYSAEVGGRFRHIECRQCPLGRSTFTFGAHGVTECLNVKRHQQKMQMQTQTQTQHAQTQQRRCPSGCLVFFNGCGTCSCAGGRTLSCTRDPRFCHGRPPAPSRCLAKLHAQAESFHVCPKGKFVRDAAQSADTAAQLKCGTCPAGKHQPRPDQPHCIDTAAAAPTPPSW